MRIVLLATAIMMSACPTPRTAEERREDAEKAYGSELRACVKTSETRGQADECADRVRQAWEIDGGVR